MSLLQYDERLFLPEQKDQTLPRPTLDLQIAAKKHKPEKTIWAPATPS
ncbi:hypothetical protein CCACVL1_01342 [Corchorus capsularis]|uniref:Uncharacterized protein n=2 Tax=Corchorus capsularis TaxID=210143 RepID=A0A1R3KJI8_COCAP|nr:hypothetical protein CCACVL1_01342 [Corchorus capsularis]